MRQPPSDQHSYPPSRRPFTPLASPPLSYWLKHLGLLMLGVGLGVIGVKWLSPESTTSTRQPADALEVEAPAASSGGSERDAPDARRQSASAPAKVADATVCVKTFGPGGGEACASGVSIDPQLVGMDAKQGAVVLTNFHVIAEPIAGLPVQLGGKGKVFRSQVIKQSPEFDLALLYVPGAKFPQAALADSSPAQGTAVRAIGFPNNQPLTVKESTLLGETGNCLAVAPCLAMEQGTITHGNSGGPLEADEKVIGITEGETSDEIAIPVEQIQQFLADNLPAETPSMERFPSSDRYPRQFDGVPPMREPHYPVPPYMDEPYPPHGWL